MVYQKCAVFHVQKWTANNVHCDIHAFNYSTHTNSLKGTHSNQICNNRKTASTSYSLFLPTTHQHFILNYQTKTCGSVNSCSWNTHLYSVLYPADNLTVSNMNANTIDKVQFYWEVQFKQFQHKYDKIQNNFYLKSITTLKGIIKITGINIKHEPFQLWW